MYITGLVDFTPAYELLCQVWFRRGYRAVGFDVVCKCRVTRQLVCGCPFKGQSLTIEIVRYLSGVGQLL